MWVLGRHGIPSHPRITTALAYPRAVSALSAFSAVHLFTFPMGRFSRILNIHSGIDQGISTSFIAFFACSLIVLRSSPNRSNACMLSSKGITLVK
jgi:hypothetical protein